MKPHLTTAANIYIFFSNQAGDALIVRGKNANRYTGLSKVIDAYPLCVFYLSVFFLFPTLAYSQSLKSESTVLAWWSRDSIFIAADSKAITDDTVAAKRPICKIHFFDNRVAVAITGSIFLPTRGDVVQIARWATAGQNRLSNITHRFRDSLRTQFFQIANTVNDSVALNTSVETLFAATSDEEIETYLIEFLFDTTKEGTVFLDSVVKSCPTDCDAPWALLEMGFRDHIGGLAARLTTPYWKESTIPQRLRELILLECAAHPDSVGEPIEIFRLDRETFTWIPKERVCAEARLKNK